MTFLPFLAAAFLGAAFYETTKIYDDKVFYIKLVTLGSSVSVKLKIMEH